MICIKENCLLAGADQPLENFYFRKDSGKYRNECKVCWKAATRKFAIDHPEQTRELSKQYRVKHAEEKKYIKNSIAKRIRKKYARQVKNIEMNIKKKWLSITTNTKKND